MIGASPNTEWLNGCVALDRSGFVQTGYTVADGADISPYAASQVSLRWATFGLDL